MAAVCEIAPLMKLLMVLEGREAGGVRVNTSLGSLSQGQGLIEQSNEH